MSLLGDQLRYESTIEATQLALNKWTKLAYGVHCAKDPAIRRDARRMHARLTAALRKAEEIARA